MNDDGGAKTVKLGGPRAWLVWALAVTFVIYYFSFQTGYAIVNSRVQAGIGLTVSQVALVAAVVGGSGVTANIICPSDIYPQGDRPAGSWTNEKLVRISCEKEGVADLEALMDRRAARTPAGRSCRVEDVAELAAFLASPLADYINAQVIGVNGGALPN